MHTLEISSSLRSFPTPPENRFMVPKWMRGLNVRPSSSMTRKNFLLSDATVVSDPTSSASSSRHTRDNFLLVFLGRQEPVLNGCPG